MNIKNEWTKSDEAFELFEMLKAIAHPSRIAIVFLLSNCKDKRMTVKDIYQQLELAQPVISRHLGILKNGGLVKRVIERSTIFYELCQENKRVKLISECFSTLIGY